MPKLYITDTDQELEEIFTNPDYDQSMLQDWFRNRYGDRWPDAWRRYLETGDISW